MEQLLKDLFLYLAKNQTFNILAHNFGFQFGADRFVAGETIEAAVQAVKQLNEKGIVATVDHLGEFVSTEQKAVDSADYCVRTLNAIHESGVTSHLSVKLTQIGLDISKDLCLDNLRKILARAQSYGNFVRIDMEDYAHNEVTLEVFRMMRKEFGETVGLVIQSYLYKSEQDVADLNEFHPNLRLVKGAYKEPASVAFPDKVDVDNGLIKLIDMHLLNGNYAAVATHDENIINHVKEFAKEHSIPLSQFEFQLLYGIRTQLQLNLAAEGYTVRVYVPYGDDWYGYFMRRLAERPANVNFVLKGILKDVK